MRSASARAVRRANDQSQNIAVRFDGHMTLRSNAHGDARSQVGV
jgi:hypothetical protein